MALMDPTLDGGGEKGKPHGVQLGDVPVVHDAVLLNGTGNGPLSAAQHQQVAYGAAAGPLHVAHSDLSPARRDNAHRGGGAPLLQHSGEAVGPHGSLHQQGDLVQQGHEGVPNLGVFRRPVLPAPGPQAGARLGQPFLQANGVQILIEGLAAAFRVAAALQTFFEGEEGFHEP